ncbi:MAG: leucine-rich repeat domain-containing protein [Bacteroidales bacterium]|nr:leucine-rich repeat domain-containing protein [Bacteroidales bacterium]
MTSSAKYLVLPVAMLLLCTVHSMAQPDKVYTSVAQIKNPLQVYQLQIRYKRLKKVPLVVFECKNLRVLDLSKNFIDTLPPEIGTLANLEELNLHRNKLRSVPPEMGRLKNLRVLNLSRNPILELPPEMCSLSKLEKLILWMTGVVEVPPTFVSLNQTLKELDMRACPMTYDNQEEVETILPSPKKRWDYVCNCK